MSFNEFIAKANRMFLIFEEEEGRAWLDSQKIAWLFQAIAGALHLQVTKITIQEANSHYRVLRGGGQAGRGGRGGRGGGGRGGGKAAAAAASSNPKAFIDKAVWFKMTKEQRAQHLAKREKAKAEEEAKKRKAAEVGSNNSVPVSHVAMIASAVASAITNSSTNSTVSFAPGSENAGGQFGGKSEASRNKKSRDE
jgi:hypothetical protein